MTNANFIETITVIDPDTNAPVELEVYKDEQSGGLFAIDSSYLDQVVDNEIPSPFNKYYMLKLVYTSVKDRLAKCWKNPPANKHIRRRRGLPNYSR